jgi:hypothetical protein
LNYSSFRGQKIEEFLPTKDTKGTKEEKLVGFICRFFRVFRGQSFFNCSCLRVKVKAGQFGGERDDLRVGRKGQAFNIPAFCTEI